MSSEILALIMDCVVLLFLGVTIIYAYKLTKSLQDFRAHRSEFDSVIANLISSIDKAERAIHTLKQTSAQEAGELERLIEQAKILSGELGIINQASEGMASRLENLAEKNSKIARGADDFEVKPKKSSQKVKTKESDMPSFMIKDVDEREEHLQSQAEKELLAALRGNKQKPAKRGRKKA